MNTGAGGSDADHRNYSVLPDTREQQQQARAPGQPDGGAAARGLLGGQTPAEGLSAEREHT